MTTPREDADRKNAERGAALHPFHAVYATPVSTPDQPEVQSEAPVPAPRRSLMSRLRHRVVS